MKKAGVGLLLLWGFAVQAATFEPTRVEKLSNGVQVAYFEDPSLPLFSISLVVKGLGPVLDPPGKSSMSSWLGASLLRGNAGRSYSDWVSGLEEKGIRKGISVQGRAFVFSFSGLTDQSTAMARELHNLVLEPNFSEPEMQRERVRILEEWDHVEEYPTTLLSMVFSRLLGAGTSAGRGSFFSKAEFSRLTVSEVRKTYFDSLQPDHFLFVLTGRGVFDPKIKAELESWKIPRSDGQKNAKVAKRFTFTDSRIVPSRISEISKSVFVLDRPDLNQATVQMGWKLPGRNLEKDQGLQTRYRLANAILGDLFSSRLNRLIRDDLGLTYGISSQVEISADLSAWTLSAATQNSSVAELLLATDRVMESFRKDGITEAELETAKGFLNGGYPLGLDTAEELASQWAASWIVGLPHQFLSTYQGTLLSQTRADINTLIAGAGKYSDRVICVAAHSEEMGKGFEKYLKSVGRKKVLIPSFSHLAK